MGDPLSVAGTAVGIISLGLSVCKTIVDYGRAYRGFDEDIQNLKSKAESLGENLEVLKDTIEYTRTARPETAIVLSNKTIRIERVLLRLESKLKRYGPSKSSESLARKTFKKTTYPFRKDEFRDLAADLDSVQDDLQAALAISSYKHTLQISRCMEVLMSKLPPSLMKELCEEQELRQLHITSGSNPLTHGYLIRQKQQPTIKQFRSYSLWLGHAIDLSFNMTIGAGGFSICPSLKVQVVISYGHSTMQIVDPLMFLLIQGRIKDDNLQLFKDLISERAFDLSCAIVEGQKVVTLLDIFLRNLFLGLQGATSFQIIRLIEFLLDESGGSVSPDFEYSNLIWTLPPLQEKHVPLLVRLANSGFNFHIENYVWWTHHTKHNVLLLLSKHDSLIRMPETIRLICREDAAELRKALRMERLSPSGKFDWSLCLLWAFGWPEGVQIILEFSENPKGYFDSPFPPLTFPGNGNHASAALLLRAGCFFDKRGLNESISCEDRGERMSLLVNELAMRRKRLRALAEDSLPQSAIPGSFNDILDGPDCLKVLDLLVDHRIPLSHSSRAQVEKFLVYHDGNTVYHGLYEKQCAEALYRVGFLGTDVLDSEGNSPLNSLLKTCPEEKIPQMVKWHILKGANVHRRLSWTNESIGHLLVLQMAQNCAIRYGSHSSHMTSAEDHFQRLIAMGDEFFAPTRIPDGCSCPCSLSGCTAVSMIIRELIATYPGYECSECVRIFFERLQEWDQSYRKEPRVFIRSLTFNALDLNHTCFANTKKGSVLYRPQRPDFDCYINDNNDEESSLNEFEELLEELEREFDEVSLPLKEFLSGPWYRRVKDHLLMRQSGEEQAIAKAKSVGVSLDFCGLSVPRWMDEYIAKKVEEVSDEDQGNEE